MDRRKFLTLAAAGAGAAVRAGPGPYGALGSADSNGIELPAGFTSRVVAHSGQPVGGTQHLWHSNPDGGACFQFPSGGWVYVSNSDVGEGGGVVSAIRFDAKITIVDSYSILNGTSRNC